MDILTDLAKRLADSGVDTARLTGVIDAVRRDWAGERVYIARSAREARQHIERRNIALLRDYQRGERVPLLARRYCVSIKRVYAILRQASAMAK